MLRSFDWSNALLLLMKWSSTVKILQKIYKLSLFLLHAARLVTRLTGVRPAVDLGWKALIYLNNDLFLGTNGRMHYHLTNLMIWPQYYTLTFCMPSVFPGFDELLNRLFVGVDSPSDSWFFLSERKWHPQYFSLIIWPHEFHSIWHNEIFTFWHQLHEHNLHSRCCSKEMPSKVRHKIRIIFTCTHPKVVFKKKPKKLCHAKYALDT